MCREKKPHEASSIAFRFERVSKDNLVGGTLRGKARTAVGTESLPDLSEGPASSKVGEIRPSRHCAGKAGFSPSTCLHVQATCGSGRAAGSLRSCTARSHRFKLLQRYELAWRIPEARCATAPACEHAVRPQMHRSSSEVDRAPSPLPQRPQDC